MEVAVTSRKSRMVYLQEKNPCFILNRKMIGIQAGLEYQPCRQLNPGG